MVGLEAKGLRKVYNGVTALNNGTLTCKAGTVCGLLGANGSGKSTFSKMIAGVVKPDGGEIWFDGKLLNLSNPEEAKRNGIIMVHQHLSLIPELTIWENITLGSEPIQKNGFLNDTKSKEIATYYLRKFSPELSIDTKVKELSLAQMQFVEIAKAISQQPNLLILDEPTAPLEQSEVEKLFAVMKELTDQGTSIIFISHRLWEIKNICNYVVVFRNGETVGKIDFEFEEKDDQSIVSMITGTDHKELKNKVIEKDFSQINTAIDIRNFKFRTARGNVDFSVRKGEVVGIGGLQGQGQEQLLNALSGLDIPTQGEVRIDGEQVKLTHPKHVIKSGMVLVPGDRHKEGLFLQHDVYMNLLYPQLATKQKGFFINRKKMRQQASQVIEQMNIVPNNPEKVVQFLSGGNQQKVVVGKWLPLAPKVLLLSDPAKGVDVNAKRELYGIVKKLAEGGTAVLLYASDHEELMDICDRILIMFEDKIVDELKPSDFSEDRFVASSLRSE